MACAVVGDNRERGAAAPVYFKGDGALKADLVAFKCRAEFAFQRRVAGFPHELADAHATPVDVAVAEAERCFPATRG